MTGPMAGMAAAVRRAFRPRSAGTPMGGASPVEQTLEKIGLASVTRESPPDDVAEWAEQLWHAQDDFLEPREREWQQAILYAGNEQHVAWHRDRRAFIPKRTLPWRVRSVYNIVGKAVNLRVRRLTENKPTLTVQALKVDREAIEKAEFKETLFWSLWATLRMHYLVVRARRWATKCASGFMKFGWDPHVGEEYPATRKVPVMGPPQVDPASGQEIPPQIIDVQEYYLDAQGQQLALVEETVPDPDSATGGTMRRRNPAPPGTQMIRDGEVFADVRSPFNIRWDQWTDAIEDSWYVQDTDVLPASRIAGMFPNAAEVLENARVASEEEIRLRRWTGVNVPLFHGGPTIGAGGHEEYIPPRQDRSKFIDREYVVRETWILPKTPFLAQRWGKNGCRIVTVGGEVASITDLPKWARTRLPFVQFIDIPEEGNHYGMALLRWLMPLQDDINRARSQRAERVAILSRILFGAMKGHGLNVRLLAGLPAVLMEYRSEAHKPEPVQLSRGDNSELEQFYQSALAAATDIGNMNDASTGKLPSAGLPAKAIYALQYADDASSAETSTLQDLSLKACAEILDRITRDQYTDGRRIRVVGSDRRFMAEREVTAEDLDIDVDYTFQPGSMLTRQKEAVRNEAYELADRGLLNPEQLRRYISAAVPEMVREEYDQHEACARRRLQQLRHDPQAPVQLNPWDEPSVHARVYASYLLSAAYDLDPQPIQQAVIQLWQSAQMILAQQQAPAPGGGEAEGEEPSQPGGAPPDGGGPPSGPDQLAAEATAAEEPPPGFGQSQSW